MRLARFEGIRLALRERGYIEGQNIASEYRYAEGNLDRLPELAAELVRLKVDVIVVTGGDPDIRAAKNATKTIPIDLNDFEKVFATIKKEAAQGLNVLSSAIFTVNRNQLVDLVSKARVPTIY